MKRSTQLLSLAALLLSYAAASAQERVQFPSLGDDGAGPPRDHARWLCLPTCRRERRPAVVFLDGCAGLFSRTSELIETRERVWAIDLNGRGYVDLMVDSFRPRNHGEMCSQSGFDRELYQKRPRDAYAALLYLHAQPYVRSDRIGIIGWSEGGGAVLYAIRTQSLGRPAELPRGAFRVAVAFYPASCDERRQQGWPSTIPLLALLGTAAARGSRIELQVYLGADHGFDRANSPIREYPEYRTATEVVPVKGTDRATRQDALTRVPAFLARFLAN